jgi:hypothetical protein
MLKPYGLKTENLYSRRFSARGAEYASRNAPSKPYLSLTSQMNFKKKVLTVSDLTPLNSSACQFPHLEMCWDYWEKTESENQQFSIFSQVN